MRDPAQPLEALELANAVRLARAALKQDVAHGRVLVTDVLRDVPDLAGSISVFDLLKAQHGWGRHRTLRTLRRAGIPEGKRLADLTPRQRDVLPDHF